MFNFKISIIISIIGFVLIFFMNIIRGNILFIVLSRSLIYGILVFGVTFGIYYVFKNILGVEFNIKDTFNRKDASEKASVDIIVDDEIKKDDVGEEVVLENSNIETGSDIHENNIDEDGAGSKIQENNIDENEIGNDKVSKELDKEEAQEIFEDKNNKPTDEDKFFTESNDLEELNKDDVKIESNKDISSIDNLQDEVPDFGELDYDDNKFEENNDHKSNGDTTKSLKDRIGFDVPFQDVAKAIRTKLNEGE